MPTAAPATPAIASAAAADRDRGSTPASTGSRRQRRAVHRGCRSVAMPPTLSVAAAAGWGIYSIAAGG